MKNTAVLCVDTQIAFTPRGGLPVQAGKEIVQGVNRVLREAHDQGLLILRSVDIHPRGHISFASRWGLDPYTQNPLNLHNPSDLLWPDHSIGETPDIELIPGIIEPKECVKIYKGWMRNRDAYSAFDMGVTLLDGNATDGYEVALGARTLQEVLKFHNIQVLRIVGLVTEVCVTANALDALDQGYDIELIESGIRGLSPEGHRNALDALSSLDGRPNRQGRIQSVKII